MIDAFDSYWNTGAAPAATGTAARDLLVGVLAIVVGTYLIKVLKV